MLHVTLRVIDGADRGKVYSEMKVPVTIGREEGNDVQLNDERVSRFHLKIQEDNERLVLTDLESTNGTKVNGEDIKLRILRSGDYITVGRSVLLFGSRDDIARRFPTSRKNKGERPGEDADNPGSRKGGGGDFDLNLHDEDLQSKLYQLEPPAIPPRLSPGQAAHLAEMLEYIHIRLRELIRSGHVDGKGERVVLSLEPWQNLLDLQSRIATYLREVSDPNAGE